MPPSTVRLGVTRNLHALVSPKRRPTQTHYEVDTFMVERMTLRIPVAACAEAQRQASAAATEDTPAARLLAGLPALAKEAKPDALTSVPLTAKDPNERQVLQPVELPLAAFLQAVDAPATAHTVVDGADALDQRDGWMANVMRVATNPRTTPLRAPKVSPRKKKTSPRRRKKKGTDKALPPAPSSTAPLVVRHPSPLPARLPTVPPVDTVSKAAYRRLEAENGRLRRALAQARERRTPPTTPPPPRRDHGVQTDAHASTTSTTPPPPTVVVVETPHPAGDEAEAVAEASLADRIVRKERLEARRQVRALLGCGDDDGEDEGEAEEGEENTMVDSETVSDTASDASSTIPPPTPPPPVPPPPVPPPPVPPPPVPPPPVPPPPLAPPPLLKRDGLAALTPTLPPVAAAA